MNQKFYENYSEGLNYSYLLFGGGSVIAFLASQIRDLPTLASLSVTIFWGSIYFLPHFNEMRKKARYEKIAEKQKKNLIIRGVVIGLIGILTFFYFVLDYKFYEKNERVIIAFYTIIIIFMLADSLMKLPGKIKDLRYKSGFRTSIVISILLIVIQFILLLYPIYDYMKIKPTYSLSTTKVASSIILREMDLSKGKETAMIVTNKDLPSNISQAISNKPSEEISFLKTYRINLEKQTKTYYEAGFYYEIKDNGKGENVVYPSTLIIFKEEPIVIIGLQSYYEAIADKPKYWNNSSKYKYEVRIELSQEEYRILRDHVINGSKK
jgi:uncharacterized membrane protein HdeD (DUF308 family)